MLQEWFEISFPCRTSHLQIERHEQQVGVLSARQKFRELFRPVVFIDLRHNGH